MIETLMNHLKCAQIMMIFEKMMTTPSNDFKLAMYVFI